MISCTAHGCRERAVVGLAWSEEVRPGWTLATTERVFCNEHADEALQQLAHRGLSVTYTSFGTPVV